MVAVAMGAATICAILHGRAFFASESSGSPSAAFRRRLLLGAGVAASQGTSRPSFAISLEERSLAAVYQRIFPGVVSIRQPLGFGSSGKKENRPLTGAGFVWDESHVVTSRSMLASLSRPQIVAFGADSTGAERQTMLSARVVGEDPVTDIAVLEVDRALPPLSRGSSDSLTVGQDIYAVGNPYGLEHSFSRGIVSGISRTIENESGRPITGVIQTDVAANLGNTGGPLVDSRGAVVGMNNAFISPEGTTMAVPISTMTQSVASVLREGYVQRPSLGAGIGRDELSDQLGVKGVIVTTVVPGGPAQLAGVRPMRPGMLGDLIVGIDDKAVDSRNDLFVQIDRKRPGDVVVLKVQRAAAGRSNDRMETLALSMTLGAAML